MKLLLYTFVLIGFLSQAACRKGGRCEEPYFITASSIQVIFKDKSSGKYLYEEVNPSYNINNIRVFDENMQALLLLKSMNNIPNTPQRYWEVNFGPLYNPQTDQSSFQTELCKEFYIQYTSSEPLDTVTVCFTSKELKCGSVFPGLKVYYKGELIGSETNRVFSLVTICKD